MVIRDSLFARPRASTISKTLFTLCGLFAYLVFFGGGGLELEGLSELTGGSKCIRDGVGLALSCPTQRVLFLVGNKG